MPEYDAPIPPLAAAAPRVRQVTVRPDLTVLDLAARYHQGAFAFPEILRANGLIDGLPFDGPPPPHLRSQSTYIGAFLVIPEGGLS